MFINFYYLQKWFQTTLASQIHVVLTVNAGNSMSKQCALVCPVFMAHHLHADQNVSQVLIVPLIKLAATKSASTLVKEHAGLRLNVRWSTIILFVLANLE